ncbi:MAG: NAD(P)/FAD-dependent oxidoreductase [Nitrososphaeria archaeon]
MVLDSDIIIAGGSFSGLLCAKELSSKGLQTKVLEEHSKIGYPDKCSGVVSLASLNHLGLFPFKKFLQNRFSKIMLHSPNDSRIVINLNDPNILIIDRCNLDNYLAEEAIKSGAELKLSKYVDGILQDFSSVKVKIRDGEIFRSKYLIDARGVASFPNKKLLLKGIQARGFYKGYESDCIHVFLDEKFAPGFFSWIIPINEYICKVGLATKTYPIECFKTFLDKVKIKQFFNLNPAPIIVNGPIEHFINNKVLYVGDSAGQTKPTTGGGIYFGGAASILASRALLHNFDENNSLISKYERAWFKTFKREIEYMKLARSYYEKMKNNDIEHLFNLIKKTYSDEITFEIDYDFHISSLIKSIGIKSILSITKTIFDESITSSLKNILKL